MENEAANIKQKVKNLLADFLGVDADDIKDEYSLTSDLHMTPADITDFLQILEASHFNISEIDLAKTETFDELTEALSQHE